MTRDLAVVDTLHQLSLTMPFHVFLAVLEKTEAGGCMQGWDPRDQYGWGHQDSDEEEEDDDESFHSLDEIYDTNFSILKLVDLTGRSLGAGHSFGLEDVVQDEDAILPDEADEEDYEGYMGNSVSRRHRDATSSQPD
jgi:hypothetical protein